MRCVSWLVCSIYSVLGKKNINYRTFDFKMHFKMKENEKVLSENKQKKKKV